MFSCSVIMCLLIKKEPGLGPCQYSACLASMRNCIGSTEPFLKKKKKKLGTWQKPVCSGDLEAGLLARSASLASLNTVKDPRLKKKKR